jgi:hypothetical protein
MYVTENGYVGIQTTNPKEVLHIIESNASNYSSAVTGTGANIIVQNSRNNKNGVAGVVFRTKSGNAVDAKIGSEVKSGPVSELFFQVQNTTSIIEAMRIASTGNVGIGTTVPGYKLTINGPIGTPNIKHPYLVLDSSSSGSNTNEQSAQISLGESGRGGASLHLAYTGNGYSYVGMGKLGSDNIPDYYAMRMYYKNQNIYFPGRIGIGTSPSQALDVNGIIQTNFKTNAGHIVNLKSMSSAEGGQVTLGYGGNSSYGEGPSTWNMDVYGSNLRFFRYNAAGQPAVLMELSENGPVQIYGNLRVHGQVTWPDRVFKKGYRLRSLEEVETFVGQNNHLPDIPSEQEVEEQGVTVMDMFAKQLQKIEELTLYMIELKKENKRLQKRVAALEKDAKSKKQ